MNLTKKEILPKSPGETQATLQNKASYMIKKYQVSFLFLLLILTGCDQSSAIIAATSTELTSNTQTTQISSAASSTDIPKPTQPTERDPAPPGLVYCSQDQLWAVHPTGEHIIISPNCRTYFSPDYRYAFYPDGDGLILINLQTGEKILETSFTDSIESYFHLYGVSWAPDGERIYFCAGDYGSFQSDIWVIDIPSAQKTNLTNSSNRVDGVPHVLSGSGVLLFNSYSLDDQEMGPYRYGYLTSMEGDGSNYQVLSDDIQSGSFSVSPNGSTAAIFGGRIYQLDKGIQEIDLSSEGSSQYQTLEFIQPAWAPNNKYISWSLVDQGEGSNWSGFGIYDLEKETLTKMYTYQGAAGEGFLPAPEWSPDSNWISITTVSNDSWINTIRLIKIDSGEEHILGEFDNLIWDPVSSSIVLNPGNLVTGNTSGVYKTSIGEWQEQMLELPMDTVAVDWIENEIIEGWAGQVE